MRGYNPLFDADLSQLGKTVRLLMNSERPIIMAGGGVILAGAFSELQALAELLLIPVCNDIQRKGSLP